MKNFLLSFLLRERFLGQFIAALVSIFAAWLLAYLPGANQIVVIIVTALFNVPDVASLDHSTITAVLTPLILTFVNAIVQEFLVRGNNTVLAELQDVGVYEGKVDGWFGPNAKKAIDRLTGFLR